MSKRAKRITYLCIILFAVLAVSLLIVPRVLVLILPFAIAYVLAGVIEPGVVFLTEKVKIPRKISALICVGTVAGVIIAAVSLGTMRIYNEVRYLVSHYDDITAHMTGFFKNINNFTNNILGIQIDFSVIGGKFRGYINENIWPVTKKLIVFIKKLPSALIFTVALVLGTYFISADKDSVNKFLKNIIPLVAQKPIRLLRERGGKVFKGYVKAQLLMMVIILFLCTLFFLIVGGDTAKYALLLGIGISVIDVLPVLGAGGILIPWSLYRFLVSDGKMGIALLILYGLCFGVRQIFEPKIVGKQIGLHPLCTLIGMYMGLNIFGFFGIILGPVLIIIIKNLSQCGVFEYIGSYISGGETDEKI